MALDDILARIRKEEERAGRAPGSTRLIAVSKKQPPKRVEAVLEAGHRLFGENRVQEAAGKWPAYRERFGSIELHLIGPLQTNKARQAVELCDAIHSLDRPKLARTLARLAEERGACPELLIQINTGEEPQKAGVLPRRGGRVRRRVPRHGPAGDRAHVHPAGRGGTEPAFRALGEDRRA